MKREMGAAGMKYRIMLGLLLFVALSGLAPYTLPNFALTVSVPIVNPVISINGSTAAAQVITQTTLVGAGSGGPGNQSDWLHICTSTGTCTSYDYTYLNCTKTQPSAPPYPTGTPGNGCTLQTPSSNGSYYLLWETSSTHTEVARLTFSVNLTGGPSITGVTVAPNTVTAGQSFTGTLSTTCSVTCPNPASYALVTDSVACATNNNNLFSISGATLSSTAAINTAGSYYACVAVTMTGVSASPVDFSILVTVQPPLTIASVSVSPNSFTIPSGSTTASFTGTLSAACNPSPCPTAASFTLSSGGGGGGPSITITGSTTVSPGAKVSVTAAGGPGHNGDQVALCQTNTQCGVTFDFSDWAYLDCTKSSSTLTATGGGPCSLTAFTTPGNYYADFIPAAGTSVYASTPFTVSGVTCTAPCVLVNGAASGATVAAGATISVHAEDNSGATNAYMQQCTGTTIGSCSGPSWAYMNCSQTQPSSPIAANTCSFTAPSTTGTWYYGLINNNGLAAQASFVVH